MDVADAVAAPQRAAGRGMRTLTTATAVLGEFGDRRYLGYAECQLSRSASTKLSLGQTDAALSRAGQALDLARSGRYRVFEGQALTVLAELRLDRGENGEAARLAGEAERILAETGHHPGQQRASTLVRRSLAQADATAE